MRHREYYSRVVRHVLPRAAADLALANSAALCVLGAAVIYLTLGGEGSEAVHVARSSLRFYSSIFLPLSLTFPVAFFIAGLYARQSTSGRLPVKRVFRATASGALLFGLGCFAVAAHLPGPSLMAGVCVLVLTLAAAARLIKAAFVKQVSTAIVRSGPIAGGRSTTLVVGGAGYIGSTLVRQLIARGHHVRILDSLIYGDDAIAGILGHPNVELHTGDCRNIQSVISAMDGVQSVVHLAAIVGDPACDLDHKAAREINYAATRMLVEVAKGYKVASFLFASSCSVYGATEDLMQEDSPTIPLSVYAQTKIDSEAALLQACDADFQPIIVRLATVFGNSWRPRFDLVVNLLTAKAHAEQMITIYNGEQWRPFIHVTDVANGMITLLNAPRQVVGGQIFNLGDSRMNYTLRQVAEAIQAEYPATSVHHIDNTDRRNYRVSFDKVKNSTGFQCARDLQYGIRELKTALMNGSIADYRDVRYHNQRFLQGQASRTASAPIDAKVMAAFASALS